MNSLLGCLFLLSAVVATGNSLSCVNCNSLLGTSCTGSSVTCSSGSICGSQYTVSSAGTLAIYMFVRGCVPQHQCTTNGSITINGGTIKTSISCCDTAQCTPTTPILPTTSSQLNGKICRSCASATSDWCYTSDTIQCSGNENMCLLQTTKVTVGSQTSAVAIRGCSTKTICDLGSQSVSDGQSSVTVKFICTSGSIGLRCDSLTPAILSFLLFKLFY
ncbi:testis-expressed protein 101 [Pelodytes ibericus]